MAHPASDDRCMAHPEVLTLHWEGPPSAVLPTEVRFPHSPDEWRQAQEEERRRELTALERGARGRALWEQIRAEARRKGDETLWERRLHAFWWVKLASRGSAGDYARRHRVNHATVRTWISEVAKLAYEVGYRLHEDRLLLVGRAPRGLRRLRELVNRDAGSPETWSELRSVGPLFRGEDPYFHLNEGHVLRARGRLRESDGTLREGLTIAEAHPVRALLWNARGQTFWDCEPGSAWPLADRLRRAERCFRRAVALDPTAFFPYVNLAQLAVDANDLKRAEYWMGELGAARKRMDEEMRAGLARYLDEAEWTRSVEPKRFWRSGPARWLAEAKRLGVLALAGVLLLLAEPGAGAPAPESDLEVATVVYGGPKGGAGGNRGGAGGN